MKSDDQGMALGLTFVTLGMLMIVVIAYWLAILLSLVMTIVSIAGWTRDLTLGSFTIPKTHCRAFIPMGVAGEIAAALLISWMEGHGLTVSPGGSTALIAGGYAVFGLGGLILLERIDGGKAATRSDGSAAPSSQLNAGVQDDQSSGLSRSFTYAGWDDGEKRP